jgi:hypothetical protein
LNGKIIEMKLLNLKTGKKVSKEIISILMKKQLITVKSKYISENCVEYCKLKYMVRINKSLSLVYVLQCFL